jgi:hypothetical protein
MPLRTRTGHDHVVLPTGRAWRPAFGPSVDQLLYIWRGDLSYSPFAELRQDMQAQYGLVTSDRARAFGGVVLEPARGQFGHHHLRTGWVGPSPAVDVSLCTGEPGEGVSLGEERHRRAVVRPGVPVAGLVPARGQLPNAAEVVATSSWHAKT